MDHDDRTDPLLAEALRRAAPSPPFDRAAVRARIERSLAEDHPTGGNDTDHAQRRLVWRWAGRFAAMVALFLGGAWYGQWTMARGPDETTQVRVPPGPPDQIVIRNRVRIAPSGGREGGGPLDLIARWWSGLIGSGDSGAGASSVLPETWAPRGFGLLLRGEGDRLFAVEDQGGRLAVRLRSAPVVAAVLPGGASARAGLAPGDVITRVGGHPVLEQAGTSALLHPGPALSLTYRRGEEERRATLIPPEDR